MVSGGHPNLVNIDQFCGERGHHSVDCVDSVMLRREFVNDD